MTTIALHGKNLDVQFIYPGGTISLNGDYRKADLNQTTDLLDQSAGADADRTFVPGIKDKQFQLTTVYQEGGTVLIDAIKDGTSGTLLVSPEGTATGKRKMTIPVLVASRTQPFAYDGLVEVSVTFQGNGAVVDGAN